MSSPPQRDGSSPWLRFAGLGVELAGAVLGFALVGIWIDRTCDTGPWGVLIATLCGLVGGLYNFLRSASRALRDSGSESSHTPDDEN